MNGGAKVIIVQQLGKKNEGKTLFCPLSAAAGEAFYGAGEAFYGVGGAFYAAGETFYGAGGAFCGVGGVTQAPPPRYARPQCRGLCRR